MNKNEYISNLTEAANSPQSIHGIYNWCDSWCERCKLTEHCTVYKTSVHLPFDFPEDFYKTLSTIFEATVEMLNAYCKQNDIDVESLKDVDYENEYERKKNIVCNESGFILAKQYGKQVKRWFDIIQKKEVLGIEIRLQDKMLADCFEVIKWYQYLFEVKLSRALMSQRDEEEEHLDPYDSIGNAKLLLVSIKRNIGAWGYVLEKFKVDEDEILDILVSLQKLHTIIEQKFPNAYAFIRPGLDE